MENHDSLNEKSVNNENLAPNNENEALPEENVTPIQSEEAATAQEAAQAPEATPAEEVTPVEKSAPKEEAAPEQKETSAEKPAPAKGKGGFFAKLFAHKAALPIAISAVCVVAVVAIVLLLGLGGSKGCDHEWLDATCSTPKTCSLCDATEGEALGHALVPHDAKAPTCLEKGYNEYVTCSRCNYTTYQELAALGHTAGAAATCTTAQTCTVCNAELAAAFGHTPGAAPTCTTAQTCTVCNTELVAALDHTPGAAATCTTAQTCTVCNAELAAAAGHKGGTATCLSKAECTVCGEEYGPEPTHAWGTPVTVDPDCDTDGSNTYTCSVCGDTKVETIPATNHSYTSVVTVPTCVGIGYTTYTCSVCGDNYVADEVDATGHSLADRTSCDQEIQCSKCDYIDHGKSHTYGDAVVSDVTCIDAKHTYTCSECGHTYAETVGFSEAHHDIEGVTPVETQEGCLLTKVWKCKECGVAVVTETEEKHETVTVITKEATCSATGTTLTTCKNCDYELPGTIETNDSHNWNEGVLADTIRTFTCQDCGATKTVIDASDKTNTNVSKDELASSGEVALKDANINFGNEVNEGGALAGKDVNVSAEKVGVEDLPALDQSVINKIGDNPIYNFTVMEGENFISQFTDKVTVTIPYVLQEGEDVDSIVIWFIADNGEIEAIEATYANGYVTFETDHFSTYTVTRMTPAERCEAWGHNYKWTIVEGTCTTDGYERGVCVRCRDIQMVITSVAPGHSYVETVVEATCTTAGSKTYACENCTHSYSVKIPATGHTFELTDDVAPACGVAGKKTYSCACGYSYDVPVAALKHVYVDVVTAPTCETRGYTTHTCSICANTYVDSYVAAIGHSYTASWTWDAYSSATLVLTCANDAEHVIEVNATITEKSTVPTCTVAAVITYTAKASYLDVIYTDIKVNENSGIFAEHTYDVLQKDENSHWSVCSVCGHESGKLAHEWNNGEIVTAPTCTSEGEMLYTCACGATKTEAIEIVPHTAGAEATCTTAQVCTVCNTELVAALGHDEVAHEAKAPTCTEVGNSAYVSCSRCDYTTYEEIAALGHNEVTRAAKAATCTEAGYDAYVFCTNCDYTTYVEIAALGHDEVAHEAKAPTCTEVGNNAYVSCSRCDYTTYEAIEALGHDEVAHEAKAPTCTEAGNNAYVSCTRCDYTTYEAIAALGHDEIKHYAKSPTCTEAGYNTYVTCSRCDYTTFQEVPAKGHTAGAAATCTDHQICVECLVELAPALGHTIEIIPAVEPTCTAPGSTAVKDCSVCGLVIEPAHEIPMVPHTYDDNYDATCNVCGYERDADCRHENTEILAAVAATCTTAGLTEGSKCNDCGEILVHQTFIAALGHDEIAYEAKLPTCLEDGNKAYVSCSRCDYTTFEAVAALGHDEVVHEAKAPTCTAGGHNEYVTCGRCDYTTRQEIAALGHDEIAHDALAPTCTEAGYKAYVTCSRCDYTTFEAVAALGHDEVAHDAKAPTCVEAGNNAYVTCSRCDYTTYVAIPALGHDELTHKAKAPTCTEAGHNEYVTCTRCDYTTYEAVAALGHTAGAAATCTTAQVCTVCNVELAAALGHDEVAHEAVAPTCTVAGNEAYVTCSRCDYTTFQEVAPLGHDEIAHDALAPTCTEAGYKAYVTCSRCDYTTYEAVAALGHNYVDGFCSVCGIDENHCDHTELHEVYVDLSQYGACKGACALYFSCDCGEVRNFGNSIGQLLVVPCDSMSFTNDYEDGDTERWQRSEGTCSLCGLYLSAYIHATIQNCQIAYTIDLDSIAINGTEIIPGISYGYTEEYHNNTEYSIIDFSEFGACGGGVEVERCSDCGKVLDISDTEFECNIDEEYVTTESEDGKSATAVIDQICPDCGLHVYVSMEQGMDDCTRYMRASIQITMGEETIFEFSMEEVEEDHKFEATYHKYGPTCDYIYKVTETCTVCGHVEEYYDYGHTYQEKMINFSDYGMCDGYARISYCPVCDYIHNIYELNPNCKPGEMVDESYVDENGVAHSKQTAVCTQCGVSISYERWTEETPCETINYSTVTFSRDGEVLVVLADDNTTSHHDYEYTYEFENGNNCQNGVYVTYICKTCGYTNRTHTSSHNALLQYKYENECGHVFEFYACPCGYNHYYNMSGNSSSGNSKPENDKPGYGGVEDTMTALPETMPVEPPMYDEPVATMPEGSFEYNEVVTMPIPEPDDYYGDIAMTTPSYGYGDMEATTPSYGYGDMETTPPEYEIETKPGYGEDFEEPTPEEDGHIICSCGNCGLFIKELSDRIVDGCTISESYELIVKLGDEVLYEFKYENEYDSHNYNVETSADENGNTVITTACQNCGEVASQTISNAVLVQDGNKYYYDLTITPEVDATYTIYSLAGNDTYVELYQLIDGKLKKVAYDDDDGYNTNFMLTYELKAGETYVYRIRYLSDRNGVIPYILTTELGTCSHNYGYTTVYMLTPGATSCEDGVMCIYVCTSCGEVSSIETWYDHDYQSIHEEITSLGVCYGELYINCCTRCNKIDYCDVKLGCRLEWAEDVVEDENGIQHRVITQTCADCGAVLIYDYYSATVGCTTTDYKKVTLTVGENVIVDGVLVAERSYTEHDYVYEYEFLGENQDCEEGVRVTTTCSRCNDVHYTSTYHHHQSFTSQKYDLSELGGCQGSVIEVFSCPCGENKQVGWDNGYHTNLHSDYEDILDDLGNTIGYIEHYWCDCGFDIISSNTEVVDGCTTYHYRTYTASMNGEVILDSFITLYGQSTNHKYEYQFNMNGDSCEDGYTVITTCRDCDYYYYDDKYVRYDHNTYLVYELDPSEVGCCEYHQFLFYSCPCGDNYHSKTDISKCDYCGIELRVNSNTTNEGCVYTQNSSLQLLFGEEVLYEYANTQTYTQHTLETTYRMADDGTLTIESVCSVCGFSTAFESQEAVLEDHKGEYWYDLVFTPDVSGYYTILSMTSGDTYVELYRMLDGQLLRIDSADGGAENGNFRLARNLEAGSTYVYRIRFWDAYKSGSISYMLFARGECHHSGVNNAVHIALNEALGCEGGVITAYICTACGEVSDIYTNYRHNYNYNYVYFEEYGGCSGSYIRLYGCTTCGKIDSVRTRFNACSYISNTETHTDDNGIVHNVTTYTCENCGMVFTIDEYSVKDEACLVRYYRTYNLVIGETVVIDNQTSLYMTDTEHAYAYDFVMNGTSCEDGYTVNGVCADCGETFSHEANWHESYEMFTLDPVAAGCGEHHYASMSACPCGQYFNWNFDADVCEVCGLTVYVDTQENLENCVKTITRIFSVSVGENALYSKTFVQQYTYHNYEMKAYTREDGTLAFESVCSDCGDTVISEAPQVELEEQESGQYWYDLVFTPEINGSYVIRSIGMDKDAYLEVYRISSYNGEYEYCGDSYGFHMEMGLEAGVTFVFRMRFSDSYQSGSIRYMLYAVGAGCSHNHGSREVRYLLDEELGCDGGVVVANICLSCGGVYDIRTTYGHNYNYNYVYFEEYGGCSGSYLELYACDNCGKVQDCYTGFHSCRYNSESTTYTDDNGILHSVTTYTCENCRMVFTIDDYFVKDDACVVKTYCSINLVIGETVVIENKTWLYSTSTEHAYAYDFVMNGTNCEEGYTVHSICVDCGYEYTDTYYDHRSYRLFTLNPADAGCCDYHYAYFNACPCGYYCDWNYDTSNCAECGLNVIMDSQESIENCIRTITRSFTIGMGNGETVIYEKMLVFQDVYHTYETNAYLTEDGRLVFESVCSGCGISAVSESCEVVLEEHDGEYWYDLVLIPEISGYYTIQSMTEGDTYVGLYRLVDGNYERIDQNDDGGSGNNFRLEHYLDAGETYVYRIRFYSSGNSGSIRYMLQTTSGECSHDRTDTVRVVLNEELGCEGGVIVATVCQSCGGVYDIYTSYSHNYSTNYMYFEEYGGCNGSYLEVRACNGCGNINRVRTRFYNCNCSSNTETFTDAEGIVHNVTTYTCESCGMVYTEDCYFVKDAECNVREYRAYTLVIGETVVLDNLVMLYQTYTEHDYEYTFDMNGTSCEDGYTERAVCKDCGNESANEYSYHNTYTVAEYDLTEYGACSGYVNLYACPCGQETNMDFYGLHYSSYNEYDENGRTYCVNVYSCYDCEAKMDIVYYVERDASACRNYYYYTVIVTVGDTLVADFAYTRNEVAHNYVYTGTLLDGATSCNQGVVISRVCADCGDSRENTYYYHYTFEKEQVSLIETGATCPGYISVINCACGQSISLNFEHAQCDFGQYGIDCWVDGYLAGSINYLDNTSYASYGADMYICAVTDPEQCAYKIRHAYYWLKAEDECYAYQYVTYQFGYNEETGECAYEISVSTGNKMIWHNYTVTDVSNSDIGLSGTHYDCPDCGSYYYTESTYRNYFSESKIDSVNTLDYSDMTEYHYYNMRDRDSSDDGYSGSETTSRYVYRDGTERINSRKSYYDYTYQAPFGSDSYIYHTSRTDSYGSHSLEEYGYTYYNGNQYTVYYQYESGDYSYREDYTYDFNYVAPFGEQSIAVEKTHTNSDGENYVEAYARTYYKGYEYTLYTQTTHADGSFTRYDYAYDVAERVADDGTTEKYLASCHVVCTYTDSNGANEVTENDDHKSWYWQTIVPSTCTQPGCEGRVCVICEQLIEQYELSPTDHYWNYYGDDMYYCSNCGMQNINGASGDVVLEDLTNDYGNDEFYVVGYWNRGNVEFYHYVCIVVKETGEEIILEIEPTELENVRALAVSIVDIETLALEAGYAADTYYTKIVFVPERADGSFDYAITFGEDLVCFHSIVDGRCEFCGLVPVFENASVYDNDGDGVNESYFFTPIIPEQFAAENAVHVWAGDYIPEMSSSYVSSAIFNEIRHWYCTEGNGEFFTIKVTVAEAGVYEMAIHMRMKDSKERGAKYTVNEGTEYEYSFQTSFQFATNEEAFAARENDYTMSSFMYGMQVELQAGDNYIRIEEASYSPKGQHFRDFYFVKVAD